MTTKTLQELAKSVQISPDTQTILFLDHNSITQEDVHKLGKLLAARVGASKVIFVLTRGNPNFVVKPVALNKEGQQVTE